jgi:hypothetical protein
MRYYSLDWIGFWLIIINRRSDATRPRRVARTKGEAFEPDSVDINDETAEHDAELQDIFYWAETRESPTPYFSFIDEIAIGRGGPRQTKNAGSRAGPASAPGFTPSF